MFLSKIWTTGIKANNLSLNPQKLTIHLHSRKFSQQRKDDQVIDLSYDVYDKYKSENALVIAHGLFASRTSWRSVAKRINEQTRQKVYAVDLRNHGNSKPYVEHMSYDLMANDLRHFIEDVVLSKGKANKVSVLGHSMGGKTAMTLALNNHDLIHKLIVADICPSVSPSSKNIQSFLDRMNAVNMSLLNKDLYKAKKEVDLMLCELPVLKEDINNRQFLLSRLVDESNVKMWHFNIKSIMQYLDNIMDFPVIASQFNKSTLFIGGELSNYITTKDIPSIEKYFTNYEILKVPRAGHVIHFDNPSFTINAIDEFINS